MSDKEVRDKITANIKRLETMLADGNSFDVACRIEKLKEQLKNVGLPALGVDERKKIAA